MRKLQRGYTVVDLTFVVWVVLLLVGVGGWIANIVKLCGMNFDHITGLLVVRAVGIVAAPLGAVMGYL